jgi:hypothetical protein
VNDNFNYLGYSKHLCYIFYVSGKLYLRGYAILSVQFNACPRARKTGRECLHRFFREREIIFSTFRDS